MAQVGQHKTRRRHRSRQACQIHSAEKGPETERKEEAFRKRELRAAQPGTPAHPIIKQPTAIARDSAPLRYPPRGQPLLKKGKT